MVRRQDEEASRRIGRQRRKIGRQGGKARLDGQGGGVGRLQRVDRWCSEAGKEDWEARR